MIRAKNTWALALVLCAGLWACDGGGGGGGGSGGSGGSGGTGGTGGVDPTAECGNNVREAGEECDDGNKIPGDGCDGNCKSEVEVGACDDPVDYRGEATLSKPYRYVMATIEADAPDRIQGSCGGEGGEAVFSFMAEGDGLLEWLVAEPNFPPQYGVGGISSYVLGSCEESSEDACVLDSAWGRAEIKAGQTFIVVDTVEPLSEDLDFSLITFFRLLKNKGESCDPTGEKDLCRTGLACKGTPAVCDDADAPVITRSALYYGENPSYIIAEGTDEEEDVIGYYIEPLDASGQPMKLFDFTGDGVPDGSKAYLDDADVADYTYTGFEGNGDGTFSLVLPVYYINQAYGINWPLWDLSAPVAKIRLTLIDAAGMESETVTVGPPATVGLDEACDNEGFTLCDTGLVCKGEPTTCQAGTAPVVTRTLYADRGDRGGVTFHFEGTDPDNDLASLKFEMLDENGAPKGYDIVGDGVVEDAVLEFDLTGFATDGVFRAYLSMKTAVPQIAITVTDAAGLSSERIVLELAPMVWRAVGETCDEFGFDSCGAGLICKGEPLVCEQAHAPVLARAVYGVNQYGKQVLLFEGQDDDADLVGIRYEMLDEAGNNKPLDYDGDGVADEYLLIELGTEEDGSFFGSYTIGASIVAPKIALTAVDSIDLLSERLVIPNQLPVVAAGESCSLDGWDICEEGLVCAGETPECAPVEQVRTEVCAAAPVIEVNGAGTYTGTGTVTLPSLWDQPAGCAQGDPVGMPEGIVVLRLAAAASKVTVSTDNTVTKGGLYDGDTILYVVPEACGTGTALACHDDVNFGGEVYGSTVTLNNLAAGDYTIVVDTWYAQSADGAFQVDVTVQ